MWIECTTWLEALININIYIYIYIAINIFNLQVHKFVNAVTVNDCTPAIYLIKNVYFI